MLTVASTLHIKFHELVLAMASNLPKIHITTSAFRHHIQFWAVRCCIKFVQLMQYFSGFSGIIRRSNHWNIQTPTTEGLHILPKWFIVSRCCTATKNGSLLWSDSYCRHILVVTSFVKRQPQSSILLHKITFTMHDVAIPSRTTQFWNKLPSQNPLLQRKIRRCFGGEWLFHRRRRRRYYNNNV